MNILILIGIILLLLIIGGLLGWFLASLKIRRHIKKLDEKVGNEVNIDEIKAKIEKDSKLNKQREVKDNERRRKLWSENPYTRGFVQREQGVEDPHREIRDIDRDNKYEGFPQDNERIQIPDVTPRGEEIQDPNIDNRENAPEQRDIEEDWADFS
jgi:hypothetical protein